MRDCLSSLNDEREAISRTEQKKHLQRLKTDQTNEPLFAPVFLFLSLCQLKKLQHDYK